MAKKAAVPKSSVQFFMPHELRVRLNNILEEHDETLTEFMNKLVEGKVNEMSPLTGQASE